MLNASAELVENVPDWDAIFGLIKCMLLCYCLILNVISLTYRGHIADPVGLGKLPLLAHDLLDLCRLVLFGRIVRGRNVHEIAHPLQKTGMLVQVLLRDLRTEGPGVIN